MRKTFSLGNAWSFPKYKPRPYREDRTIEKTYSGLSFHEGSVQRMRSIKQAVHSKCVKYLVIALLVEHIGVKSWESSMQPVVPKPRRRGITARLKAVCEHLVDKRFSSGQRFLISCETPDLLKRQSKMPTSGVHLCSSVPPMSKIKHGLFGFSDPHNNDLSERRCSGLLLDTVTFGGLDLWHHNH